MAPVRSQLCRASSSQGSWGGCTETPALFAIVRTARLIPQDSTARSLWSCLSREDTSPAELLQVPPPLPCSLLCVFEEEKDIASDCSGLAVAEKMLSVWHWWIMLLESGQNSSATGKTPQPRQKLTKSSLLPFPTCVCSKLPAKEGVITDSI